MSTGSLKAVCERLPSRHECCTNRALGARAPDLSSPVCCFAGADCDISAVTFWEVVLKSGRGKLDVGDPRLWWARALADLAATSLLLRPEHVAEFDTIPEHHWDPFDRVLIAQAMVEDLAFVTTDREISRYASSRMRVIS